MFVRKSAFYLFIVIYELYSSLSFRINMSINQSIRSFWFYFIFMISDSGCCIDDQLWIDEELQVLLQVLLQVCQSVSFPPLTGVPGTKRASHTCAVGLRCHIHHARLLRAAARDAARGRVRFTSSTRQWVRRRPETSPRYRQNKTI